jgi:hypothetical protein
MADLKGYYSEIMRLNAEGYGSIKIKKMLNFPSSSRTIREIINRVKRKEGASVFTKKLEESKFETPENWSYGWLKTKEASIFIKNSKGIISYDNMREDFIKEMSKYSPKYPKIDRKPIKDKHLLVVDIADLHVGKLAEASETGDEYNSKIAKKRAIKGVEGILKKASGFEIEKILFIIGNDVLHVDNANKSTTSLTPQDVDGSWHKNYIIARDIYIEVINMLTTVADVHVIHNPSNHDFISGFMLADSIYCWFRLNENVTFNVTNKHRKYYKYGQNLIGSSHGDGAKMVDMPLLMANESKKEWAETSYRYVYLHHIHHKDVTKFKSGKDYQGVTVEYLRSPSGSDAWHDKKGYCHAPKAIESFVHSYEFGQVARITHLFKS